MLLVGLRGVINMARDDRLELYDMEEEFDDVYSMKKERRNERPIFQEREEKKERVFDEASIIARQAMPRMEEFKVEPLNRMTPNVIGSLFDRIKFLTERLEETKKTIEMRKELHQTVLDEIDVDIGEKLSMESGVTDINEKRNLKLDISILRKEKRHETLQFWRDVLELKTELRELMEKFESESKIVNMFNDLKTEKVKV